MQQDKHKLFVFSLTIKRIGHDNYRIHLQMSVRLTTLYMAIVSIYIYVLNNMIFRPQSVFVGVLWLAEEQIISLIINAQSL